MKIDKTQKIADLPILKVRDFLKKFPSFRIDNVKYISLSIKLSIPKTKKLIHDLTRLGYLEITTKGYLPEHCVTIQGAALRNAKAIPSITKEKAEQIYQEFMKRVAQVNKDSYFLFKVDKVILFGSFISNVSFVNDIDIAIHASPKEKNPKLIRKKEQERIVEAANSGVRFRNIIHEMLYPYTEFQRFLIGGSRYISLHDINDRILKKTKTSQVFPIRKKKTEK